MSFKKVSKSSKSPKKVEVKSKEWTSTRPKPNLNSSYWPENELNELVEYMDWHGRHPHCTSPRLCLDEEKRSFANNFIDDTNPEMVYNKVPYKNKPLTEEFLPKPLGKDCNLDEVSVIASTNEWKQRFDNDFEDPWYAMSVRDSIELTHVTDDQTIASNYDIKTVESSHNKEDDFNSYLSLASKSSHISKQLPDWAVAKHTGYEGGSPWIMYSNSKALTDLADGDIKSLSKNKELNNQIKLNETNKRSRFTEHGTALQQFHKSMLDKKLDEVIELHSQNDIKDKFDQYQKVKANSNDDDDDCDDGDVKPISFFGYLFNRKIKKTSSSETVVMKFEEDVSKDKYENMLNKLGGDRKAALVANKFIKYSNTIRDKTAKKSVKNHHRRNNFIDSCIRLFVNDVKNHLALHGLPIPCEYDNTPLFYYLMNKLIQYDIQSNSLNNTDNESIERKRLQEILDLLIKYRININDICEATGYAPIHLIAINNDVKVLRWFLQYKPKTLISSVYEKYTAIQLAAKFGHMLIIIELYRNSNDLISLDDKDSDGRTILHIAAMYGQTNTCYYLLKLGISKDIKDNNNKTASELARQNTYNVTADTILTFADHTYKTYDILNYWLKMSDGSTKLSRTSTKSSSSNDIKAAIKKDNNIKDIFNSIYDKFVNLFHNKKVKNIDLTLDQEDNESEDKNDDD